MPLLQAIQPLQCSSFPPRCPQSSSSSSAQECLVPQTKTCLAQIAKSAAIAVADQQLDQIPEKDTFSWNSLIRGHLADAAPSQAILVYTQMLLRGVPADKHTLPRVVTACRLADAFFTGRQLHGHALKLGLASHEYVVTALMSMYGQFDGAEAASKIFDASSKKSLVSWTLMARLYAEQEKPRLALLLFYEMVAAGIPFDSVALVTALGACGTLRSVCDARKIHELAKGRWLEFDVLAANALLKAYFECAAVEDARRLFHQLPARDMITWTTVIGGYVQNGGFNEGLKLFRAMCVEGRKPDNFAVSAVLPACARMSACKHGKEIHGYMIRHDIGANSAAVHNALMDMYVKAGRLDSASKIFARMLDKDSISWTVMILGHSLHGQGEAGVELFREMERGPHGLQPDETAYHAVVHACSTARMVKEGRVYFGRIKEPRVEHLALFVSLLARAGLLDEARGFVDQCWAGQHPQVQRALLDGCRIHQDVNLGKRVAERLVELEPLNAENYVMLSNIYAVNAKWSMVEGLRETIRDMGLRTRTACSWIEVGGKVHAFGVGDVAHPRSERIRWELQGLMKRVEEEGAPTDGGDFSLHDVDEERDCIPSGHSEMLAVAFGLISTSEKNAVVRVTKNLRLCRSCHASAKQISRLVGREIVVKDPDRFHHFRDGVCSCKDFW
ncbi:hypothetical protein Taro_010384 [Colocasia esculenta]|uniref:DYW domain-containing protein n=1 Tax=Colocasia esculenta TaxID=4460 RepID=A0A843U2V6_COLES|nr:hypothetical protein [Colocasia esculenta]